MKLMIVGSWSRTTLQEIGSRFAKGEHAVPPESLPRHYPLARSFIEAVLVGGRHP